METQNNFAIGSIPKHIMSIAGPMIVAQLINVLYNVIDRIYIGRIPHVATLAMGGLGICLPIISIVMAFANLFGMGGSPLCSIARGKVKMMTLKKSWVIHFLYLSSLELLLRLLVLFSKKIFYGLLVPVNILLVMLWIIYLFT